MISQDRRLRRLNDYELEFPNELGVPVRVLANSEIPLEKRAVDELANLLTLGETVARLPSDFLPAHAELSRIVLTPDFHKGAGIPIGTVMQTRGFAVPQAVGNDVNCGMRLAATNITREKLLAHAAALEKALRYVFFEGGRKIQTSPERREALLRFGLPGLLDSPGKDDGLWRFVRVEQEREALQKMHGGGSYRTEKIFALDDYVREGQASAYDALIGNIGGGNHFVELQYVKRIHDGGTAREWGLQGEAVMVMIHSGSLGLGHVTGGYALDLMKSIWPSNVSRPENGILPLPYTERFAEEFARYRTSLYNAANFAFGNRFFLQLMVREAFEQVFGECDWKLVYDAPHNFMWENGDEFIHRKGATPAGGFEQTANGPHAYRGEPVIVPGSMGSASFLLAGRGNDVGLCSACHGAGRIMPRGTAIRADDALLDAFLRDFRVITPVDIHRPDIAGRRDIIKKWRESLKQEAPYAYKDITPVIDTLVSADVARPVAELWPLMTIKG